MEDFQNVNIMMANYPSLLSSKAVINLCYIGASSIRKTNFFSQSEMAVILYAMNTATHKVRSDDDAQVRESSSKFPNFECPVGSKPNNTHMVNCHMACSQSTMLKFATEFDDTLVSISEEAPNHKMILARCGMNFSHKFTNVDISKFKEFAKKYEIIFISPSLWLVSNKTIKILSDSRPGISTFRIRHSSTIPLHH